MNHFTVMLQKRLKNDEDEVLEEEEKTKGTKTRKSKGLREIIICFDSILFFWFTLLELKISELEEWVESDEDNSDEDEEIDQEKVDKKKKLKGK